jgi:hypothetical protein
MKRSERRGDFILSWEEPAQAAPPASYEWSVEISTDQPRLLGKLGGRPRRFRAPTRESGLAGARWFADSLSFG